MSEPTGRIVCDLNIMMGKPVIKGTRITVEFILEELGSGQTVDSLIRAHPRLTIEDVRAALAFAAQTFKSEAIYPPVTSR